MTRNQKLYAAMAFFSVAGLVSSFWQLLDKIDLLKHPGSNLSCNLNHIFNCSKILSSHQYEVFGFPNAMIGIVVFSFFLGVAFAGLGGSLRKKFMLAAQVLALFMLGFINWFLFESIFRIHALCLFCTIIGPSVLAINALMLRLNQTYWPKSAQKWMARGADIFLWILLLLAWIFVALIKLG